MSDWKHFPVSMDTWNGDKRYVFVDLLIMKWPTNWVGVPISVGDNFWYQGEYHKVLEASRYTKNPDVAVLRIR